MTREGKVDSGVISPLWLSGWNWVYIFIAAPILGIFLGFRLGGWQGGLLGFLGFFGGPTLAVVGLAYVHLNKSEVIDSGSETVKQHASEVARLDGQGSETFSLLTEAGDSLPLLPKPKRKVATLVVEDSLLLVHDSAEVDLPGLSWEVGESTTEYYYDQISSVNYEPDPDGDGGEFWVNLSDGHGESWETTTDANDALRSVQDRIRSFKTQ